LFSRHPISSITKEVHALKMSIESFVDYTHSTFADLFEDLVMEQPRSSIAFWTITLTTSDSDHMAAGSFLRSLISPPTLIPTIREALLEHLYVSPSLSVHK